MDNTDTGVRVELLNSNGAPTAYVTQANTMTLRLTNQTGAPVVIRPGVLRNPPPGGGAFGVALYFSALFTDAGDQAKLTITATGWAARYIGGDFPAWILAATQETTWDDGDALEFAVGSFMPTVPVGTYYLSAGIYNLAGPPMPYSVVVGVANPPSVQKQDLSSTVTLNVDHADVVLTKTGAEPAANRYVLSLINTNPNSALVPDEVPWEAHPPKFTLGFQYAAAAPGYFALTTPDAAGSFQVGIAQDPSQGWHAPVKGAGPTWVITPRDDNHGVLGTGLAGMVQFSIDNVLSQLGPGPTLLYLQYNDVPGYNDGFLSLVLTKRYAAMRIAGFSAGQTRFPVTGLAPATAYLNWEVDNSVLVELSGVGTVPSKAQAYPVTLESSGPVVLTAYDPILGAVATRTLNLSLVPPVSQRWLPCGAITAWRGDTASIPPGFGLCDGTRGTPDLRDRFVMGAGGQEQPGDRDAPTHTHQLPGRVYTRNTSTDGAHTHGMPAAWYARNHTSGPYTGIDTCGELQHDEQTQSAGDHSHSLTVSTPAVTSGAESGGVRPAWYALCYIMLLFPS
ncbi:MAG TPA: hypothetical protein VGV85_01950 [Longimicrobiaceae bacterium]|nr:hypothetical protein [Longimicrobiaceae bacterium]